MHASIQEFPPVKVPAPSERLLSAGQDWAEVLTGRNRAAFIAALELWLPSRRWFRGKARTIKSIDVHEQIDVPMGLQKAFLLLFQVTYTDNDTELYVLPLTIAVGAEAEVISRDWPQLILAQVTLTDPYRKGVIYDAIVSKDFCRAMLALAAEPHQVPGQVGDLQAEPTGILRRMNREHGLNFEPSVSKAEQSNSSIIYKGALILKFFRRLDQGINPELEIERFLSARHFPHSPPLAGALEYRDDHGRTSTMAVITSFVPGCHDAWADTLAALDHFYQKVQDLPASAWRPPSMIEASASMFDPAKLPQEPADLIGSYLQDARTLGQRTAALHLLLASDSADPAFRPEPWTAAAQESLYESLRDLTRQNFNLLRRRVETLTPDAQALGQKVLPLEEHVTQRFQCLTHAPVNASRIRTHGDYHLGQVLHHEADFLIIDFEGEPAISLAERRTKQSALRDVAGMIYSFFYAANAALRELPPKPSSKIPPELMTDWARYWSVWAGATFLSAYLEKAHQAPFIPADPIALKVMLDVELLRKAIYELGYELNNRPDWSNVAFQVLLDLLNPENPI